MPKSQDTEKCRPCWYFSTTDKLLWKLLLWINCRFFSRGKCFSYHSSCVSVVSPGVVSLKPMTSQFKPKQKSVKCIFCKQKSAKCIFCGAWFKIVCEILRMPFEISHEILNPYIAKYTFYEMFAVSRNMISASYGNSSLSEAGSWGSMRHMHQNHMTRLSRVV